MKSFFFVLWLCLASMTLKAKNPIDTPPEISITLTQNGLTEKWRLSPGKYMRILDGKKIEKPLSQKTFDEISARISKLPKTQETPAKCPRNFVSIHKTGSAPKHLVHCMTKNASPAYTKFLQLLL